MAMVWPGEGDGVVGEVDVAVADAGDFHGAATGERERDQQIVARCEQTCRIPLQRVDLDSGEWS